MLCVGAAAVRLRLLFAHPLKIKGLCVGIGDVTAQEFAQGIEVHFASQLSIIPLHLCEARRCNGIERIEIDLAAFERLNCYFLRFMFALLMVLTNIVLPLASSLHLQNTRFHYFRLKMFFSV